MQKIQVFPCDTLCSMVLFNVYVLYRRGSTGLDVVSAGNQGRGQGQSPCKGTMRRIHGSSLCSNYSD